MRKDWQSVAEHGTAFGIWFVLTVVRCLGRRAARLLLYPIAAYYLVRAGHARNAIADYRRRLGLSRSSRALFRHLLGFTHVTLDRVFFVQGRADLFHVTRFGHDHLASLHAQKTGAILLSAHLGSFEVARMESAASGIIVNVVVDFSNAARMNNALARMKKLATLRLIPVGGLESVLRIKECIEQGELVAIMGDRVLADQRSVTVPFLGRPARFPTGPYLIAAVLRCPVYLTFGLYLGGNHYTLHCEPFAHPVVLPRAEREPALTRYATQYADRLATFCQDAPDNWFNFFDFWEHHAT